MIGTDNIFRLFLGDLKMLTLYQFPISHYCEKIRWALDYKQLDYEIKNLLPGLHTQTTKKLATQSTVPILLHNQKVIQNSSNIIHYLDDNFLEYPLTPEDPQLKAQALEWERYADINIGIHLRRYYYHVLLEHPNIVIPFLSHRGAWYGKLVLICIFPQLKSKMRTLMNINEETAQNSKEQLEIAINKLHDHLQENSFIVGNQFTRADLSTAALLAPLCKPEKYGLDWPDKLPQPLEGLIDQFQEKLVWVDDLYEKYR